MKLFVLGLHFIKLTTSNFEFITLILTKIKTSLKITRIFYVRFVMWIEDSFDKHKLFWAWIIFTNAFVI